MSALEHHCWCCQTWHVTRGDGDPWEGRMEGYCDECATNRCDCYPDECPIKHPPRMGRWKRTMLRMRRHLIRTLEEWGT